MIIVNGWKPLTIITKCSILDVAAVLDPPLGFEELVDTIRILYDDVADDPLQYFRTPTSVDIVGMHQALLRFLLLTFGTCSTELMMNYHAETIVEGWHRTFQDHVSAYHPVFWKFLSVLQKEENMIRISIVQQLAGHLAPPPRQVYLDSSRRILKILDDNPNRKRLQYLKEIAHNLTF